MTAPRRFFGKNPPGRLPATMVKVLTAELSDSGRFTRGKRYFADDAVLDIDLQPGLVTASVQGSRRDPYLVQIGVTPGNGVPLRRDIDATCTCPDAREVGHELCKHGVAAMIALSNEISIEPEVLDVWRSGGQPLIDRAHDRAGDLARERDTTADGAVEAALDDDELAEVIEFRRPAPANTEPQPVGDLTNLLHAPNGSPPPEFGPVTPRTHPQIGDPLLDDTLQDALVHLQIRWE